MFCTRSARAALRLWARARCGGASGREGGHDFALQLPKARAATGRCEGETGTSRVGGGPSVPGPSQARLSMAHPDPEGASLERCCSPREPVLHSPEHHCVCPGAERARGRSETVPSKKRGRGSRASWAAGLACAGRAVRSWHLANSCNSCADHRPAPWFALECGVGRSRQGESRRHARLSKGKVKRGGRRDE